MAWGCYDEWEWHGCDRDCDAGQRGAAGSDFLPRLARLLGGLATIRISEYYVGRVLVLGDHLNPMYIGGSLNPMYIPTEPYIFLFGMRR